MSIQEMMNQYVKQHEGLMQLKMFMPCMDSHEEREDYIENINDIAGTWGYGAAARCLQYGIRMDEIPQILKFSIHMANTTPMTVPESFEKLFMARMELKSKPLMHSHEGEEPAVSISLEEVDGELVEKEITYSATYMQRPTTEGTA